MSEPEIDAELISLTQRLWQQLGISNKVTLQINSLGSAATRANYREQLITYFQQHIEQLDEDSKRRLTVNPLRILDSKNPELQPLIQAAPKLLDVLDDESAQHFSRFKSLLDTLGIAYIVNPNLVRGLDYYNRTVFEWVANSLGAQNTICAGGRYDSLVELLGGNPTPAIGFAMGLERILLLLQDDENDFAANDVKLSAYLVMVGEQARQKGLLLAEQIRSQVDNLALLVDGSGGSFKQQLKRADKSGADLALILGDNEMLHQQVGVKHLRNEQSQQETVNWAEITSYLQTQLR
jgi:histidyl-tRNA synthetase